MGAIWPAIKGLTMKIVDLGTLDGQVLLFGGPYSNFQATSAMRAVAQRLNIGPENTICTGDVVAYCANPVETVELIRDWGCSVVAGNCEIQLAAQALDCGCGFDAGTTCDLLSAGWYAHANANCSSHDRAWMGTCPDLVVFTHLGKRYAVLHGGLTDVSRFIWPTTDESIFRSEIKELEGAVGLVDAVVSGHSGISFTRQIGDVTWINAGVIGMPPNNGRTETTYALLGNDGRVSFCELSYDHKGAASAMRSVRLVQGYDSALLSGDWPSEDVLPKDLRRQSCAIG